MTTKTKSMYLCPTCLHSEIKREPVFRVSKFGYPYTASDLVTFCNKKNHHIRKQVTKCGYYQNRRLTDFV